MTGDFVRTPDERFANLVDFPDEPKYVEVDGLRMAHIEEGSGDAGTFLLLHGEPIWGVPVPAYYPAARRRGLSGHRS